MLVPNFNHFFFFFFNYLKESEQAGERKLFSKFVPATDTMSGSQPGSRWDIQASIGSSMWLQDPKHLDHSLLLSGI